MATHVVVTYRVDRILPQICTASAQVNMKHMLKRMQYRFAVIYETLSITKIGIAWYSAVDILSNGIAGALQQALSIAPMPSKVLPVFCPIISFSFQRNISLTLIVWGGGLIGYSTQNFVRTIILTTLL